MHNMQATVIAAIVAIHIVCILSVGGVFLYSRARWDAELLLRCGGWWGEKKRTSLAWCSRIAFPAAETDYVRICKQASECESVRV